MDEDYELNRRRPQTLVISGNGLSGRASCPLPERIKGHDGVLGDTNMVSWRNVIVRVRACVRVPSMIQHTCACVISDHTMQWRRLSMTCYIFMCVCSHELRWMQLCGSCHDWAPTCRVVIWRSVRQTSAMIPDQTEHLR